MPASSKPASPIRRAPNTRAHPTAQQRRAAFHYALDAYLIADDQGNYVDANPTACTMLGYAYDEITRHSIFDTTPSAHVEMIRAWWNTRRHGEPSCTQNQWLTQDGQVLDVECHVIGNLTPGQHLIILRDQSERARDERLHTALYRISEAAHAAKDLDELYRIAHEIVGTLMPAHNFYIALYDAQTDLFSFPYHRDEFDPIWEPHKPSRGLTTLVLRTGKPLLATPEVHDELLRTNQIVQAGTRAVDWLGVPLQTQAGTIGVLAVQTYTPQVRLTPAHRDILVYVSTQIATAIERKRAQQALQHSEERFRKIFEEGPIGIALLDLDFHLIQVNPAVCQMLGYRQADILNHDWREFTLSADIEQDAHFKSQIARGEIPSYHMDKRYVRHDGQTIWASLTCSTISDADGKPAYYLSIIQDINERKFAEQQIRAALQEKEILLREIHHRVKNNLNVVSGLLELQANLVTDVQAQHAFAESQKRIRAMALLHETLYRGPDLARINIANYLNDLVNYLQTVHQHSDLVQVTVQVDQVTLNLDTAILCGLIINELVTNAFKYAFPPNVPPPNDGWRLEIGLKQNANLCALEVNDNGVGMPAQFDWRHTQSLGLQLVELFARQLGDDIRLDTRPGTRWQIIFAPPPERRNSPATRAAHNHSTEGPL